MLPGSEKCPFAKLLQAGKNCNAMIRLFCTLAFGLYLARQYLPAQPATPQPEKAAGETGYFRLWIANDVAQRTDRYYTGGIRLEYAGPECGKTPLRHLLVSLGKDAVRLYGVAVVADAFTPTRIGTAEVLEGDRPYAGYLYAGHFLVSRLPDRNLTLTTRMNVGIIGPSAGMQRAQKGIHQWLDLERPLGWHNQIASSLLVDYSLQVAHTIPNPFRFLELTAQAGGRAGTLYNHLGVGSSLRVGKLDGYAGRRQPGKSLLSGGRYYVFVQSEGSWVVYNATLQGGLLNTRSRYTLHRDQVSRTVFGQTTGAAFTLGHLSVEVAQTWVSREFEAGGAHRWNHLSLTLFF